MQDIIASRVNFVNNPLDINAKNQALRAYAEIMYYNTNGKIDYRNDFSKIPPVVQADLPNAMEKSLYAAQNKSYKDFRKFAKIALKAATVEPLKQLLEIAQKQSPLLRRAQVAALSDVIRSEFTPRNPETDFQKRENLLPHNGHKEYVEGILNACERENLNVTEKGLKKRVTDVQLAVADLQNPQRCVNIGRIVDVLTSDLYASAISKIQNTGTPQEQTALKSAQEKVGQIVFAQQLASGLSKG
jgi:hypothetical protein